LAPRLYGFYSKGEQLEQGISWRYLPIRGYSSTYLRGNKGALLASEYRFPLWYPEVSAAYGYAFLEKIWGDLFFDIGGATFENLSKLELKKSIGAELNLDLLMVWYLDLNLKLGYAKGLDTGGEEKFYLTFGLW
jgi:hypothetical protein